MTGKTNTLPTFSEDEVTFPLLNVTPPTEFEVVDAFENEVARTVPLTSNVELGFMLPMPTYPPKGCITTASVP